ncbi:MAG: microcin ABC transporter permease, partial [Rhodospirillales bacterium]|nr:microcin ABC transporter permease [Rhodospirillales bacterium]
MALYLLRRLLLLIPTLLGIIAINFAVVQLAPGGPVEQVMAELRGHGTMSVMTGTGAGAEAGRSVSSPGAYRGASGMDPHTLADVRKMFGFDKPPLTRFLHMLGGYLRFDFGRSFFRGQTVLALIAERLPVSLSLGLWSTLLIYAISIPLGIRKAVRDGSRFDTATSGLILVGYAVPSFLLAI